MAKVLVCGALAINVIAQNYEPQNIRYRKGSISLNFGGTGHDMAINMKELGHESSFLGIINDCAMANLGLEHLKSHDVNVYVQTMPALEDNISISSYYKGLLQSATASDVTEQGDIKKTIIEKAVEANDYVIATTTLSNDVLKKIEQIAIEKGKPFFINITAERFVNKVAALRNAECIFMNEAEADKLARDHDCLDYEEICKGLGVPLIIIDSDSEIKYLRPETPEQKFTMSTHEIGENTLGVGDLMVCNLISSYIKEGNYNFEKAANKVEKILNSIHGHLGSSTPLRLSLRDEAGKADEDILTGALNRRGIDKFVERRSIVKGNMSIMLVDIDHFKKVNDTYGHHVGDIVIQRISAELKHFIRATDAFCRWGGEEFLLLLPGIGKITAEILAEKMRKHIETLKFDEMQENITISIGLSERKDSEDFQELVQKADEALYKAKDSGRNQVVVY